MEYILGIFFHMIEIQEMRRKEAMLSREKAEKEKLAQKIAAMEGKLLTGGGEKTIVDHTNEQQRALEQRRAEVAARSLYN